MSVIVKPPFRPTINDRWEVRCTVEPSPEVAKQYNEMLSLKPLYEQWCRDNAKYAWKVYGDYSSTVVPLFEDYDDAFLFYLSFV